MMLKTVASLLLLSAAASAQTYTLSGCHRHGNVEYCYLPNGSETPWTTYAPTPASTAAASVTTGSQTPAVVAATATPSAAASTAVRGCHAHGQVQFCVADGKEWEVTTPVNLATAPDHYDNCHAHGAELHCTGGGQDVTLRSEAAAATSGESGHGGEGHNGEAAASADGVSCHFHAGVEHCVDANGNTVDRGCKASNHTYNVPLRIGLLFAILVGSALGVLLPIFISRFAKLQKDHIVLIVFRQFGAGIILSTALVHLFTHAQLFFSNECLTGIHYEATTAAIVMAGIFVTFSLGYIIRRVQGRPQASALASQQDVEGSTAAANEKQASSSSSVPLHYSTGDVVKDTQTTMNASVVEAGIIFHSILLGVTLVVAGDSAFITLFVVILFHQIFEGIALGSCIAVIPKSFAVKLGMGAAFAVTTPIGMAIGIGVLSSFNGNDPSTIIAIGTLNAFSAGVLLWVGLVDLLLDDWRDGALATGGPAKVALGFLSLVAGLVLMSLLGKWA